MKLNEAISAIQNAVKNFILPAPNEPPYVTPKVEYKPGTEKPLWAKEEK